MDYNKYMFNDIHYVKEVPSTNTVLKELARSGISEGYVLVAESQTSGRGRLGRSFYSPPSSGLYFSLLLRPQISVTPASLTCLSAVSLAETVCSYGIDCKIKWVNDLYCGDRKAAGILTEGSFDPSGFLSYAIIGIGLNIYMPKNVPAELEPLICGIFPSSSEAPDSHELLIRILNRIEYYYKKLPDRSFWQTYRDLLNCFGKKVSFMLNNTLHTGTAEDIDKDFRLIIRTDYGHVTLDRGEVNFL